MLTAPGKGAVRTGPELGRRHLGAGHSRRRDVTATPGEALLGPAAARGRHDQAVGQAHNLTLKEAESVVTGHNGAGKSTLALTLGGLAPVSTVEDRCCGQAEVRRPAKVAVQGAGESNRLTCVPEQQFITARCARN